MRRNGVAGQMKHPAKRRQSLLTIGRRRPKLVFTQTRTLANIRLANWELMAVDRNSSLIFG